MAQPKHYESTVFLALTYFSLGLGLIFGPWLGAAQDSAPVTGSVVTEGESAAQAVGDPDRVIAKFEGGQITVGELDSWRRFRATPEVDRSLPPTSSELEAIAVQKHLEAAAIDRGLDRRTDVRMALWWFEVSRLEVEMRRRLATELELPESVLDQAVEELGSTFNKPHRVRLRNLFKRMDPAAGELERERLRGTMETLRARIVAGEDFAALARAESDSQSKWRDGLLGWVKRGTFEGAIEEVIFGLEAGETSPVVELPSGFTFFYCEAVKPAEKADPAEVRSKLRQRLRRAALVERVSAIRDDALNRAEIELLPPADLQEGSSRPAVELGEWALSAGEVETLATQLGKLEDGSAVDDFQGEAAAKVDAVEEFVYRRSAAEWVMARGIHRESQIAAELDWGRRGKLVAFETQERVMERFEPLAETALRTHFEEVADRYRLPETYRLGLIRRSASVDTVRQVYKEMETLQVAIESGEITFEAAARKHSELVSGKNGGTTAWLTGKQVAGLGPVIYKAFAELSLGETSSLVQQSEGVVGHSSLWVLRYLDRRPPRNLAYDEVRSRVENELGNEKVKNIQANLYGEIVSGLDIRAFGEAPCK